MINFKKMDEKDFVFGSKPLSNEEEQEFSEFLKSRKEKAKRTRITKNRKNVRTNNMSRPSSGTTDSAE
jgi:hypothetical protein